MTYVLFYEKPGCINNTRQKGILEDLGHEVTAHNLLTEGWSAERLRPFFGQSPVKDWFNSSSPRIKSGEVDPVGLEERGALLLMLDDPLLIRRPLIEVEGKRMAGFEACDLLRDLGVLFEQAEDLQSCTRIHPPTAYTDKEAADV